MFLQKYDSTKRASKIDIPVSAPLIVFRELRPPLPILGAELQLSPKQHRFLAELEDHPDSD